MIEKENSLQEILKAVNDEYRMFVNMLTVLARATFRPTTMATFPIEMVPQANFCSCPEAEGERQRKAMPVDQVHCRDCQSHQEPHGVLPAESLRSLRLHEPDRR